MNKNHFFLLTSFIWCFLIVSSCFGQIAPQYEFRGAWIATVENIDWPSEPAVNTEKQKKEYQNLLDHLQETGINAVIVQIRPCADAFYQSEFEPWSKYLTGRQGTAPDYDPMTFMISEAHKRGMVFHAWINPYRALLHIGTYVTRSHVSIQHPEWCIKYGTSLYFNPGLPQVRTYLCDIIKDIIKKYDIDGIHFDDYFYPYPIDGKIFEDNDAFKQYGNGLSKADWRRSNCDSLIAAVSRTIKQTHKPICFGISPFGVWRTIKNDPSGSNNQGGISSYDDLYANVLLWLKKGWIDYVAPQLYWGIGNKLCDFKTLLDWWNQHTYGRQLFIGQAVYRAGSNKSWKNLNELPNEIRTLRQYKNTQGSIFFSASDLLKNKNGWADSLALEFYPLPAIVPPMPWLDARIPKAPLVEKGDNKHSYKLSYHGDLPLRGYVIYDLPEKVSISRNLATIIRIIPTQGESAIFDKEKSIASPTDKLFVASLSANNEVSAWIPIQ